MEPHLFPFRLVSVNIISAFDPSLFKEIGQIHSASWVCICLPLVLIVAGEELILILQRRHRSLRKLPHKMLSVPFTQYYISFLFSLSFFKQLY